MLGKLGMVGLQVLNPRGTAGGKHGQHAAIGNPLHQFRAFLHNGEVRGEVGVVDPVKADLPEGRGHLAGGQGAQGQPEVFRNADPYRRSALYNRKLLGVIEGGDKFRQVGNVVGRKEGLLHRFREQPFRPFCGIHFLAMIDQGHIGLTLLYALAAHNAAFFNEGLRLSGFAFNRKRGAYLGTFLTPRAKIFVNLNYRHLTALPLLHWL